MYYSNVSCCYYKGRRGENPTLNMNYSVEVDRTVQKNIKQWNKTV